MNKTQKMEKKISELIFACMTGKAHAFIGDTTLISTNGIEQQIIDANGTLVLIPGNKVRLINSIGCIDFGPEHIVSITEMKNGYHKIVLNSN